MKVIEKKIISIIYNYIIWWYETTLITIKFNKDFINTSVKDLYGVVTSCVHN